MRKVIRINGATGFERGQKPSYTYLPVTDIRQPEDQAMNGNSGEADDLEVILTIAPETLSWIDPLLEDLGVKLVVAEE
ncbi:MAG TPA: hypothetical protein VFX86_01805 [Candidatus Saccharimonadales bacterium]|nr:hypothetical protein [Candidatus Saccharimonadales bacterium]